MKRYLVTSATVLLTCSFFGFNNPANAGGASFDKSCTNISINDNLLSANCRQINGGWNQSSLVLRGIENVNGNLKVNDYGTNSNYNLTCSNLSISGNRLRANCQKRDGSWKRTSVTLNGIENVNGVLTYTSDP